MSGEIVGPVVSFDVESDCRIDRDLLPKQLPDPKSAKRRIVELRDEFRCIQSEYPRIRTTFIHKATNASADLPPTRRTTINNIFLSDGCSPYAIPSIDNKVSHWTQAAESAW